MNKERQFLRGTSYMKQRRLYRVSKRKPTKKDDNRSVADIVRELKQADIRSSNYRDQSLKIHGLICAKCGREFDFENQHLLTVHHKDGNHLNNPPDGSNWENLCVYCHDDEHSRNLLGDSLKP
jgi:5-methylcytosine-specific restriction endonuclease McrA